MADGDLTFGTFECKRTDKRAVLDVFPGIWSAVEVRGKDEVIVGKPGRLALPRVEDRLVLNLVGWLRGVGATKEARWESFREIMDEAKTAFALTTTANLVASGPYLGLESGETATIEAATRDVAWGVIGSDAAVQIDVELECVSDPPDWVVTGS